MRVINDIPLSLWPLKNVAMPIFGGTYTVRIAPFLHDASAGQIFVGGKDFGFRIAVSCIL
jgi:hypothetical protein